MKPDETPNRGSGSWTLHRPDLWNMIGPGSSFSLFEVLVAGINSRLRFRFCPGFRFDESLWHSVDLEGLTHMDLALQQVLKTRVHRLRCPRAFVEDLQFTGSRWILVD